jgi:asparagine synthase (glutamine-hydrolysing)
LYPLGIATLWYDDAAYQLADYSVFEGIPALPPAHRLTWDESRGTRVRRYWRLQPVDSPLVLRDERDVVEAFKDVFGDAVARSMRGSRGTALMLSGGMDSAAILAARRGFRKGGVANDLLCVSAVMDRRISDAVALAEDDNILAMTSAHPNKLQFMVPVPDARDALVNAADLAEAAWSFPHPSDQSLLVPALACRLARDRGCRLILNGVDGDNVTADRRHYMANFVRAGRLLQAWRESGAAARVNTYLRGQSPLKLFLYSIAQALEPAQVRQWRSARRAQRLLGQLPRHPDMAQSLIEQSSLPQRLQAAAARKVDRGAQQQCDHLAWWLGNSLQGSESIVSRYGMEVRHPWCDLKVVEFFRRLPPDFRSKKGWSKWVVREACEDALGGAVVWHSGKHHHGSLLTLQMLKDAAPYLRRLLDEQRSCLLEYINETAISEAIAALGPDLDSPFCDCDRVGRIVGLATWLKHVKDSLEGV